MLKNEDLKNTHFEILDNFADLVRVKDTENNVIYTNDTVLDNFPNNNFPLIDNSIEDILTAEENIDGKEYSIKSSPVYNNRGDVIASVEVFRDVTREKELEDALTLRNLEMEEDLNLARVIQWNILPKPGTYGNLDIDYIYMPSKQLSGDIFDVFDIDEDHIGIYMVDVAGHGVAASMLTIYIRQTMYNIALNTTSPSEALRKLQKTYQDLGLAPDRYFTMFYGIYSKKSRRFKFANAGHNSIPFLFNGENIKMLVNYGLPILAFPANYNYRDDYVDLVKGDSILLYTDGLIEAKNEFGDEFGEDRVKYAILDNEGSLLEEIEAKYKDFINLEQQDDIAMLLMTVN